MKIVKRTLVSFGYYFKINVKITKFYLNQERIELIENFAVKILTDIAAIERSNSFVIELSMNPKSYVVT
jgi:hypothetical protein